MILESDNDNNPSKRETKMTTATKTEKTFYLVGANNTWSTEPTTISSAEAKGFDVAPSRRFGDFQLWMNGKMCGWLFSSKKDQFNFLVSNGIIRAR